LTSRERSAADDEVGRAKFPHEASDCHGTCGGGVDHARPLSRERKVAIEAERALRHDFGNALATWHGVQEVRRAALAQRSRELAQRARIHAALEDGALDLLYPSAKDELRDIVAPTDAEAPAGGLRAKYYRFLDSNGAVIKPPDGSDVGQLRPDEEAQLALPALSDRQQLGYVVRSAAADGLGVDEVIAMPIVSIATGEVISALVLGFKLEELGRDRPGTELRSGLWLRDRLHLPALSGAELDSLTARVAGFIAAQQPETSLEIQISGVPHLLLYKHLNPASLYSPAYEIALYPLTDAHARLRQIRLYVLLAGAALLVIGLGASQLVALRLSAPVERLAVTSEENRAIGSRREQTGSDERRAATRGTFFGRCFTSTEDASHGLARRH
jgi:hypothetical protein